MTKSRKKNLRFFTGQPEAIPMRLPRRFTSRNDKWHYCFKI